MHVHLPPGAGPLSLQMRRQSSISAGHTQWRARPRPARACPELRLRGVAGRTLFGRPDAPPERGCAHRILERAERRQVLGRAADDEAGAVAAPWAAARSVRAAATRATVDVPNLLRLAHLADGVGGTEVVDRYAGPAPVRHLDLAPPARQGDGSTLLSPSSWLIGTLPGQDVVI